MSETIFLIWNNWQKIIKINEILCLPPTQVRFFSSERYPIIKI